MAHKFTAVALLSLFLPFSAAAELNEAQSKTLIANLNKTLADFAEASGFKVSYDDIIFYDEPMFGSYLSFLKPKITVSYGATYEFSTRNVALKDDGEGQMHLTVPSSINMKQISGQSVNDFSIRLNGVPSLIFRLNDSLMVNHYQIEAPDTVELKFKQEVAGGARAKMVYNGSDVRTSTWKAINKIPQKSITTFIDNIGLAFSEK